MSSQNFEQRQKVESKRLKFFTFFRPPVPPKGRGPHFRPNEILGARLRDLDRLVDDDVIDDRSGSTSRR